MEISYWQSRWEKYNTGWHMNEVYPNLPTYWSKLELREGATVLVPFCGKSLDMLWLRKKGLNVIGVEVSKKAVELFFREHELPLEKSSRASFTVYQSKKLTIWVGDFFNLKPDFLPKIDAIYDKAALIALPPKKRTKYASKILKFCDKSTQLLQNTFEYNQEEMNGPPFSVSLKELTELYGDHFSIQLLHEESIFQDLPKFHSRGLSSYLIEKLYYLEPV